MKYIDTHCHLINEYFSEEEKLKVIDDAKNNGVEKIVLPGTTIDDSIEVSNYADGETTFALVGVHPNDASEKVFSFDWETINWKNVVGIGEVGIDLHYDDSPSLEEQIKVFVFFLEMAREKNLPVAIHMRDAASETFEILKKYSDLKIVLHSYSGSKEELEQFIDLGVYVSFSGIVTFKNAKAVHEAAKIVPIDKLLSETDTPYLTPTPNRGKWPNKPEYVVDVVNFLCTLREDATLKETIYNNAIKFFNL